MCKTPKLILILFLLLYVQPVLAQNTTYDIKVGDTLIHEYFSSPFNTFSTKSNNGTTYFRSVNAQGKKLLYYIPKPGFIGQDKIQFDLWESITDYKWDEITVNVHPSILEPEDDYLTTAINTAVSINVLKNDFGTDSPLSVDDILISQHGVTRVEDGFIVFSPDEDFEGNAFITYLVCDTVQNCKTANVNIMVESLNPVDHNYSLIVNEGEVLNLTLPPNQSITTLPSNGSLEQISAFNWSYTPNESFIGNDKIQFSNVNNTSFDIYVIQKTTSFGPAKDDQVFTPMNQSILIDVKANDLGSYSISKFSQPSHGKVTLQDGKLLYDPEPFFVGVVNFSYNLGFVSDNVGQADVTITINNQVPDQGNYSFGTFSNTPKIIRYESSFMDYDVQVLKQPTNGRVSFLKGNNDYVHQNQTVNGENMIIYEPNEGYVGEDFFTFSYCLGSRCKEVRIKMDVIPQMEGKGDYCLSDCVWAGDNNHDGRVDMLDLLELGEHIGLKGIPREEQMSNIWYGQSANDWVNSFAPNKAYNYKHIDANGDGLVSLKDTTAINRFYGNEHNLVNSVVNKADIPVYLQYVGKNQNELSAGDTVKYQIRVGDQSNPAIDFSGLAFDFNYNPLVFDANSVFVDFNQNAWSKLGAPTLEMVKTPWNGRLDVGYSRVGKNTLSGFGDILTIGIVIDEDVEGIKTKNEIRSSIEVNMYYKGDNQLLSKPYVLDVNFTRAPQEEVVLETTPHEINIYPNPTSDFVTIETNPDNPIEHIEIMDIIGRTRFQKDHINKSSIKVDVNELSTGIYIISIKSKRNLKARKLSIRQ